MFQKSLILTICGLISITQSIHIQGNKLIDDLSKKEVVLQGFSHSGTEFMCISGSGIFDGPNDDNMIQHMKNWNTNAVRIPLNEQCWLGINGLKPEYSGQNYINAVTDYIQRIINHGMYVIIDLHWTAPGTQLANAQQAMPNTDHSVPFWNQAASHFKNMPNVIFDLFNEPYPDRTSGSDGWRCFRDGGSCPGIGFQVAGYQTLVNTVRNTGAKNVVMIGGLAYSNDLSQWLNYRVNDPLNQLAASVHIYNFNFCSYSSCWENQLFPIAKEVPLIVGEFGENDCQGGFVTALSQWFLAQGQYAYHGFHISHLAWTWNTWDCKSGPAVISNYDGTCTNNFGCTVKSIFENNPITHAHHNTDYKNKSTNDRHNKTHNETNSTDRDGQTHRKPHTLSMMD